MIRRIAGLAVAATLALGLASCTPADPGITASVAKQLQASVLEVTTLSSTSQYAEALAALQRLESELSEATASGKIDANRLSRIQAAIALVKADLTAALPPAPSPTPTTEGGGDDGAGDNGNGNGNGKDNPGKGNPGNGNNGNNGNGNNGNGKGGDKGKDDGGADDGTASPAPSPNPTGTPAAAPSASAPPAG